MAEPVRTPAPTAPQIPVNYVRAAQLIDDIFRDADLGPAARKKAKEKFPDAGIVFPEDNIDPALAPLKKQVEELTKRLADKAEADAKKEAEDAETRSKRTLEQAIKAARENYHLTDEGFDKMVARMKETGNFADADAAAAWVVSKEPPPKPAGGPSWAPKNLDLKGNLDAEKVKLLHTDPIAFQDAELSEFLRDPDKYVRDTFGEAA